MMFILLFFYLNLKFILFFLVVFIFINVSSCSILFLDTEIYIYINIYTNNIFITKTNKIEIVSGKEQSNKYYNKSINKPTNI